MAEYHGRRRWESETARGVILVDAPNVTVSPDYLLPRVVFRGPDVVVERVRDHLSIGPIGSRDDYLTVTFPGGVISTTGCLTESLAQFRREVEMKEPDSVSRREYEAALIFVATIAEIRGSKPQALLMPSS